MTSSLNSLPFIFQVLCGDLRLYCPYILSSIVATDGESSLSSPPPPFGRGWRITAVKDAVWKGGSVLLFHPWVWCMFWDFLLACFIVFVCFLVVCFLTGFLLHGIILTGTPTPTQPPPTHAHQHGRKQQNLLFFDRIFFLR